MVLKGEKGWRSVKLFGMDMDVSCGLGGAKPQERLVISTILQGAPKATKNKDRVIPQKKQFLPGQSHVFICFYWPKHVKAGCKKNPRSSSALPGQVPRDVATQLWQCLEKLREVGREKTEKLEKSKATMKRKDGRVVFLQWHGDEWFKDVWGCSDASFWFVCFFDVSWHVLLGPNWAK